ncbi:MAG: hypothetical protein ABIR52_09510 [Casimicrobiaceae bacterium]
MPRVNGTYRSDRLPDWPAMQAALRATPPRRSRLAAWIVTVYERIGQQHSREGLAAMLNEQ